MDSLFRVMLKCKGGELHWTVLPFAPLELNRVESMTLICDTCGKRYGLLFNEEGYPIPVELEHEEIAALEIWELPVVEEGEAPELEREGCEACDDV